jgi:protein TonB
MSEKYIEKTFLYFIALSVLLHAAAITVYLLTPEKKHVIKQEPYFIDLMDSPITSIPPSREADRAELPKGTKTKERVEKDDEDLTYVPRLPLRGTPPASTKKAQDIPRIKTNPPETDVKEETVPGEEYAIPKKKLPELAKLFPSSNQMKGLEERYRKELGVALDGGFSESLDSEDLMLISFVSRFVDAVNARFPYYSQEQLRQILADTGGKVAWRVVVVFNRNGSVADIRYTSTGSKELDNTLERVLHSVGPLGALPKSFNRDQLKVPFIYSLSRRLTG